MICGVLFHYLCREHKKGIDFLQKEYSELKAFINNSSCNALDSYP